MQKIRIESSGYKFIGKLLESKAPKTCDVFKKMLPLNTKFVHVRWSGEGIWIPFGDLNTGLAYENHISHPAIGEMLLYPGGISMMEIILSYGRCSFACQYGQLAGNHFLSITDNLDKLYEFGRKILWEGAQEVNIELF